MDINPAIANEHIARANKAAHDSEDAFGRAIWLAQSSARIRSERFWNQAPKLYSAFLNGERDRAIYGIDAKWNGTVSNYANRSAIREAVLSADSDTEALRYLRTLPWLSSVKGGFTLQMSTGKGGALDVVNSRRLGLDMNAVSRFSPERYLALVNENGGGDKLWADWVNEIAHKRGADPMALSLAHIEFIESGTYATPLFNPPTK